ncbi:MAG: ubiquinone/menaquinone biosynthesis methyltransferase [Planctomycetes bacterium]|nr:ubiquinone/menaquinone biosynthesis methyltransferase [Planctomycetota bacterium]
MANKFQDWYTEFSPRYQLTNHILTLGSDLYWRKNAAREALRRGGRHCLDLCTGTGDFAGEVLRQSSGCVTVIGADLTIGMLGHAAKQIGTEHYKPAVCEAGELPFPNNSFDFATIGFATRNLNTNREDLVRRFGEVRRVLKPGGAFFNLETSQPKYSSIRFLFHLFTRIVIGPVGGFISGTPSAFKYLGESMREFYPPEELAEIFREAGFSDVSFKQYTFGAAALHIAVK